MNETIETRKAMLEVLGEFLAARAERIAAERRERKAAELLRSWLRASGERELVDAETGVGVRLQERQGAPAYDALAIRRQDPALRGSGRVRAELCASASTASMIAQWGYSNISCIAL